MIVLQLPTLLPGTEKDRRYRADREWDHEVPWSQIFPLFTSKAAIFKCLPARQTIQEAVTPSLTTGRSQATAWTKEGNGNQQIEPFSLSRYYTNL